MGHDGKIWTAAGLAAAAALLLTGASSCDPADGLGSAAVSLTTDQLATHALRGDHIAVQWLSCSASSGDSQASVRCQGRTDDQRAIVVDGTVTEQQADTCVRGHLTATVGGHTVFDVRGLGRCADRTAAPS